MAARLSLHPYAVTYHVFEERDSRPHPYCAGELRVTIDDDNAWVEPCSRLQMTEEIVQALAAQLRPLGVVWMRGWHDGHYAGRVIGDFGARGVPGLGVHGDPLDLGNGAAAERNGPPEG